MNYMKHLLSFVILLGGLAFLNTETTYAQAKAKVQQNKSKKVQTLKKAPAKAPIHKRPQIKGGDDPCVTQSFSPEVVTFYGDSTSVLSKLDKHTWDLSDRRVYMVLLETDQSAELSIFEKAQAKDAQAAHQHGASSYVNVGHWRGASAGDLREQLSNLTIENRGIACIGEQTKSIVMSKLSPEDLGTIPAPVSIRAAFGHNIKKYGAGNYIRLTVFLFC
ncbi:MAG: hypothetical protein ACREA2_04735 [Blastocatellia bacterium]